MAHDGPKAAYFAILNEIGIINQLASTLFEAKLPPGLLISHFSVVNHLIRVRDGATPLQLARAFQVPKTTMTHTLSGLEKHGFVTLRKNPDDARSKQVWLTEAGRRFRDDAIKALEPELENLAKSLELEPETLLPQLRSLRGYLDANRNGS